MPVERAGAPEVAHVFTVSVAAVKEVVPKMIPFSKYTFWSSLVILFSAI
jgi:hypothetical protein